MKTVERKRGSEEGKKIEKRERDEKEKEKGGREYHYERIVNMIYTIIHNGDCYTHQ